MRSALVLIAGCAASVPPPHAPVAPVVPPKAEPTWPLPVRVMTWTPDGVVQVGVLPDAPPAAMPTTPWYVEPTRAIDDAMLAKLVVALRKEHVPGLSLRGQAVSLDPLRDLPDLTALVLDDTAATDAPPLALERLYLARTPIDDAAVARIVTAQPALRVLDVEDDDIGDSAVKAIASLSELRALDAAGTHVTDAGGAALGALAHLEILDLGRTAIGPKTIVAIRPLALRELFVDHTRAGKELGTLAGYAPGIVRFDASSLIAYKPTDTDLEWLAHAPGLVELAVSGANLHDKLAQQLVALPNLKTLRLAGTAITAPTIRAIAKLADLEEIDLADTPVDDGSAAAMLALPKLRVLRLDRTPIGDAALHATPTPTLAELYLAKTRVSDAGAAILDATPDLVALGLGETHVGDATIPRIAKLAKLRTLVLAATSADRKTLVQLGALHDLERLYLEQTHADDDVVAALSAPLRVLHLEGTDVSDDAFATLRRFDLVELTIGDSRVHAIPAAVWPHLRTLSLLGLPIDDAATGELAKRTSIVTLDLSSTEVTDPSPLAQLPHLRTLGLVRAKLSASGRHAAAALVTRGIEVIE